MERQWKMQWKLSLQVFLKFPNIRGAFWGAPYDNNDYSILGSVLGYTSLWKSANR